MSGPKVVKPAELGLTLGKLDTWLDTMRGPAGYTGPVAHWWETNLLFTGALYDWRYEGIIDGYLELYRATGRRAFLQKAMRAANDVANGIRSDGRFRNSSFQFGPVAGGTPHEAAVAASLLRLSEELKAQDEDCARRFRTVAETNIEEYWIGILWNGMGFQDQPYNPVLVANKHGTVLEALVRLQRVSDRDLSEYIQACVQVVLGAQLRDGPQKGGTVHGGIGPSRLAVAVYTARAINGLVTYADTTNDEAVSEPIRHGVDFVMRHLSPFGTMWGTYGSGRSCPNPHLTAGSGDILRLLTRVKARGWQDVESAVKQLTELLVAAQQPMGGIPTGHGFHMKALNRSTRKTDLRDALPVVGWVDKAFRALAMAVPEGAQVEGAIGEPFELPVWFRNRRYTFLEDAQSMKLVGEGGDVRYLWNKGDAAPIVCNLAGARKRRDSPRTSTS